MATAEPQTVVFNVGGKPYEVEKDLILQQPNTLLAHKIISEPSKEEEKLEESSSESNLSESQRAPVFIDKDPERFEYILEWYRNKKVSLPPTVSLAAFKKDAHYFGLPDNLEVHVDRPKISEVLSAKHSLKTSLDEIYDNSLHRTIACGMVRYVIENVLEQENTVTTINVMDWLKAKQFMPVAREHFVPLRLCEESNAILAEVEVEMQCSLVRTYVLQYSFTPLPTTK